MPSSSKKQHKFMAAIANNPKFAKKVGIPASVGEDFVKADEGRSFKKSGGLLMKKRMMFGKDMSDKMGRAMKGASPDKMGRAMGKVAPKQPRAMGMSGMAKKRIPMSMGDMGGMSSMNGIGGMKKGGLSKANGVAVKGKTKGAMVSMKGSKR